MQSMSEEADKQTSLDSFDGSAPRRLNLPSQEPSISAPSNTNSNRYHDMEKLYPDAPVPKVADGLVIHRAVLHDLTGVPQLLDWLADGEAAIVRMEKLMSREVELQTAIERLNTFVESDLGGQIIRLTESRLMLLPPGCRGVRGVDAEAFSVDSSDLR
tara:strand:+ start:110 stop:583 length:474 start_codon:yes stop_codon:yes gene_type:complete